MRKGLIAAGIIVAAIGIYGLIGGNWGNYQVESYEKTWTFQAGQLRELEVQSDNEVNITFVRGTGDTGSIHIIGKGSPRAAETVRKTELYNDELLLDLRDKTTLRLMVFNFNFSRKKGDIVITLPREGQISRLGLLGDSGRLTVSGAAANDVEITADSGNIKIQDSVSDNVIVIADSGNIELQNLDTGTLNIKADSGNIQGNGVHAADLEIKADSGSVRMEDVTGAARIRTDSGNVHLVKNDTASAEIDSDSGNVHVQVPPSFAGTFDLHSRNGKIDAPKSKRETDDLISVKTDNGNIEIVQ